MVAVPDDGWAALAEWYDAKQGDTGDLWHRALIDPPLIRLVGEVSGRRLLDVGCGNGYLARRFARAGATVLAVDATPEVIARAGAHGTVDGRVEYLRANAAHLPGAASGSFDLAYSNMALMDIADAGGTLVEIGRVLKPGGRLVATISHPCFDNGLDSTWIVEKGLHRSPVVGRVMRSYREPFRSEVPWAVSPGDARMTGSYHRPLSWYARALATAGLWIDVLDEPAPLPELTEQSTEGPWISRVPLHLVIGARKPPLEPIRGAGSVP